MNSLLDDDFDDRSDHDRELTLSTGMILGIFLGLVLLCGLFFGFGYKMGSHRAAPTVAAIVPEASSTSPAAFDNFKPAAGSPVNGPQTSAHASTPSIISPTTSPSEENAPSTEPVSHANSTAQIHPVPESIASDQPAAAGTIIVQVAAFTHQEDADLLVHALKAKGYSAFERKEPQDTLLHIQVGPYSNRKDAEAIKQRLLMDGYQPIVK